MFWRSKSRNRRLVRDEVLEVRLHSQKVRAARWRVAVTALGISITTLIGLLLLWRGTEYTLNAVVFKNDALAIRHIEVQTDGVIPPEQIRQWAGVRVGDNLASLDLQRIRRNLELAPIIEHAAVERVMPSTLKLRVTEREPLAAAHVLVPRANDAGYDLSVYYLDDQGYVMLPPARGMINVANSMWGETLTVLTGLGRSDLRPGRAVESPQVQSALRLIDEFEDSPMFGLVDLARIDLSSPDILLVTTGQGSELTFAMDHFDTQLKRWRSIFETGVRAGKSIASLDLSITNNLPVLWMDTGTNAPDAKPNTVKMTRHKKKHV